MTDALETRTTVSITVNGRSIDVPKGEMLIAAAERVGTYIPRFCYHPRMEPVGVCRMCLVEVDGPRGATLQPACYIQVNDGMVVTTESEKVKKAQDGVLEFLLANHPLDCPVCDKGGECPLQDQALAHGSGETRFIEEKRHFQKPIAIGELVLLDRERCIQCSRCTRFASEVAGDAQIDFAGRGDNIEVSPFPTEPFDSVFSGNTVQICPVGALTAKPYRFAARPWDLDQVESTCTTCAVGCRVAVQSSGNRVTRVLGVDSDAVNHGWLCDKGRFVVDSIVGEEDASLLSPAHRLTAPLVRRNGQLEEATWGEALKAAATIISSASSPAAVGAIGGAALTNEGAFAWERFLRGVVGTDSIDAQYGDGLDAVLIEALPRATINEAAEACTVVLLTGDLREELPVLFLRLREGARKGSTNLIEISAAGSALSGLSRVKLPVRPGEAHLVAQAIATDDAPLSALASHPHGGLFTSSDLVEARRLLGEDGAGVVFVVGRPNAAESAEAIEAAIVQFANRFPKAKFLPTLRRGNVMGALDMGLTPNMAPGQTFARTNGRDTVAQLQAAAKGEQTVIIELGGDIISNVIDTPLATAALSAASVIAITGHGGPSLAHADVVLPTTVMHERYGTVTNIEGRVSTLAPKVTPPGSTWPDVAIAAELAEEFGQNLGLSNPEETAATIEATTGYPCATALRSAGDGVVVGREFIASAPKPLDPMAFPGVRSADLVGLAPRAGAVVSPTSGDARVGARPTMSDVSVTLSPVIPLPDAYSLRLVVTRTIYDDGAAVQGAEALRVLSPSTVLRVNAHDLTRIGADSGAQVRLTSARGSELVSVVVDNAIPRGCVALQAGTSVRSDATDSANLVSWIVDSAQVVNEVRMESL